MNIIEKLGITKGPWHFNEYYRRIESDSKTDKEAAICKIYHREPGTDNFNITMNANARLIAVAPEMLNLLIAIEENEIISMEAHLEIEKIKELLSE